MPVLHRGLQPSARQTSINVPVTRCMAHVPLQGHFSASRRLQQTVLQQSVLLPTASKIAVARSLDQHRKMSSAAAAAAAESVSASGDDEQQPQDSRTLVSKPAITVRRLQASDKARWEKLFRDYIIWYKATVPDDVIEMCWQRLMEGGEGNHIGLVAQQEPDGLAIGLAHVLLHRSTWCATHYCYLEDLYVDGEVRAQGVGAALIEAVYKLADERQAPKVYWQTHEMNYRARGLYDKMGRKSQFILYERPHA